MRKLISQTALLLSLLFWVSHAFAASQDIGELAATLDDPMLIVNKLLYVAAYIIGAILFFMGVSQYKIHQKTPKLVPLTTPIFIWILSIVCLLLPFFAKLMDMDSASPEKREDKQEASEVFKAPKSSSEPRLTVPGRRQSPGQTPGRQPGAPSNSGDENRTYDSPYNQPDESDSGDDRHWSEDF